MRRQWQWCCFGIRPCPWRCCRATGRHASGPPSLPFWFKTAYLALPSLMPAERKRWSTPKWRHQVPSDWPTCPILRRDVKVKGQDCWRTVRSYNKCYAYVDVEKGCTCHTLERWPREIRFTCKLCSDTCLADIADVTREKLLQARFIWAWHCRTRRCSEARETGGDDRFLI